MMEKIKVEAAQDGLRIDAFLSSEVPELSRSAVQKLIENGSVTLSGAPVKKKLQDFCR